MKFTEVSAKSQTLADLVHFPIITAFDSIIFAVNHPLKPRYSSYFRIDIDGSVEVLSGDFIPFRPRPIKINEITYETL